MKKNSALKLAILQMILFSFLIINCSQSEGGGSGGIGPDDAPYLIEGILCSDISPEQMPVAIADNFPIGERIYIWLHWANIEGKHDVEVFWYDPDGDLVHEDYFGISTRNNRFINWFFLDTTSSAKPGEWIVSVFLDQQFIRSHVFDLF